MTLALGRWRQVARASTPGRLRAPDLDLSTQDRTELFATVEESADRLDNATIAVDVAEHLPAVIADPGLLEPRHVERSRRGTVRGRDPSTRWAADLPWSSPFRQRGCRQARSAVQ